MMQHEVADSLHLICVELFRAACDIAQPQNEEDGQENGDGIERHLSSPARATLLDSALSLSQASSDRHGVQASTATASRSAFQAQGSSRSSSWALVWPETMRSSTSVNHACGSTPFSLAVATRLATIAQ